MLVTYCNLKKVQLEGRLLDIWYTSWYGRSNRSDVFDLYNTWGRVEWIRVLNTVHCAVQGINLLRIKHKGVVKILQITFELALSVFSMGLYI